MKLLLYCICELNEIDLIVISINGQMGDITRYYLTFCVPSITVCLRIGDVGRYIKSDSLTLECRYFVVLNVQFILLV